MPVRYARRGREEYHLTTAVDLSLEIERGSGQPLQAQVAGQLRAAILGSRLRAGDRLPSTRWLATTLGVARNVVVGAYDDLLGEGFLEARHGSGTYVRCDLPALGRAAMPQPAEEPRWLRKAVPALVGREPSAVAGAIEFRIGVASVEALPESAWRRFWRAVAGQQPPADYGAPEGDPELRTAIAGYLGRSRGIVCGADDVVVTSGASQAVDLIVRATIAAGDPVALEEPGYPSLRNAFLAAGARMVPVPVDDDGLRVDRLPRLDRAPLLVCVTPSHQYPLGVRMSITRRAGLLEWAQANDSLVLEDDYDSEFRFGAPPLPALAGLDRAGRVAYVGSFSKVLAPALRVGYLVAPAPLRERVTRLKRLTDYSTPWPLQRALAAFIGGGHLERHIRLMRRHYAEKRAALAEALSSVGDIARLVGLDAGLHACLELRPGIDASRIAEAAAERGVVVAPLESFYLGLPDREGLVLGYGGLGLAEVRRGGALLAAVIRQASEAGVLARTAP